MANIKKYRGYIILNKGASPKWAIIFPDFPMIEIFTNNIIDPRIGEECCGKIVDIVIDLMRRGLDAPIPHQSTSYKPFVDIEIDLELIRHNLRLEKRPN